MTVLRFLRSFTQIFGPLKSGILVVVFFIRVLARLSLLSHTYEKYAATFFVGAEGKTVFISRRNEKHVFDDDITNR